MRDLGKAMITRLVSMLLMACIIVVSFGASANARFISPDDWDPTKPGVGTNRYAYSDNDPVNRSDPNGHIAPLAIGIAMAIGAFLGSSTPANAPGADDKIESKTNTEVLADSLIGACTTGGCGLAVRAGIAALKSKNETKKDEARSGNQANDSNFSLRDEYRDKVKGLAKVADDMKKAGKTPEEIARTVSQMRRDLGVQYKDLTPSDLLEKIYERNTGKYGDKLGPTVDYLRAQGRTWDQIVDSASRPGGQDLGL